MSDIVEILSDLRMVLMWEEKRMGAVSAGLLRSSILALENQPSIDELTMAWTRAIESEGIGGAGSEYKLELRRLRDLRTTWFGDENKLRYALDNYLRGEMPDQA